VYSEIFFTNVLRILGEKNISKETLAELADMSTGFISDITTGKGNPSLKKMEAISLALKTPLPVLLDSTDLDQKTLNTLSNGALKLPDGYENLIVCLPSQKAFLVKKWDEDTRKKLSKALNTETNKTPK
jgi:transcriptional regulator with XRE-family HTH domain